MFFTAVCWTFLYFGTGLIALPYFAVGLGCVAFCYHSISLRYSPWRARLAYLPVEHFAQLAMLHYGNAIFLTFFNLPTMIVGNNAIIEKMLRSGFRPRVGRARGLLHGRAGSPASSLRREP